MSKLAIHGGKPEVKGFIPAFNTIGQSEASNALDVLRGAPLSGFIGGQERGGYWVTQLEKDWAGDFGVRHAVACNSATSGLLIAARAAGLGPGDDFIVSPYTMSATAAAPMMTGATPIFCDVDPLAFLLDPRAMARTAATKAVFLTNLFGVSIDEGWWTGWAHQNGIKVIVDAAQSPFAKCDDVYGGTTADIGVFSLNVHKHLQCGEGGICVTNDDDLAHKMRMALNHGEMAGGPIGLNLRMTEVTAAIALAQLGKSDMIMADRIEQAESIIEAVGELPGLTPPYVHPDCTHVYYTIPWLVEDNREWLVAALRAEGVPLESGYVKPLYHLPAFSSFKRECPVAEDLHNRRLFYFENCAWSPTKDQIKQISNSFEKVFSHGR